MTVKVLKRTDEGKNLDDRREAMAAARPEVDSRLSWRTLDRDIGFLRYRLAPLLSG